MPTYRQKLKPRFAALGAIVVLVLGVLLVRLWQMQVVSGQAYASQADQNRIREITTVAPRGRILDRRGRPLVTNRATLAVLVEPFRGGDEEAEKAHDQMIARLSALLDVPVADIKERLESVREAALASRVVAMDVELDKVAYLEEHSSEFPGVSVETRAVREYPQGRLAAHVLGYTGEISEGQLSDSAFDGYDPTDIVGKSGAEASFESALQGDRGTRRLEVDAAGNPRRMIAETKPVPGRDVMLTIDSRVQKVTEKALADALRDARGEKFYRARAGAAVAIDIRTGEVLSMASLPTYDPTVFLGGVTTKQWRSLTSTESEYPLSNRAIAGQYPPASTFKAFTGLAGLQYGLTSKWHTYQCAGKWTGMGEQWKKYCWNRAGHGSETFMAGIEDSCDVVFYEIGYAAYKERGEKIQRVAREFGYGSRLGIELPGEADGRVPDAKWKKAFNEDYPEYQQWLPGDTVNLAIGQGDMLVTPLQVAATYAGIANDGKVMQPHLMKAVLGSSGKPVVKVKPQVARRPKVSAANLKAVQEALVNVTTQGTARSAFAGFGTTVAGKTGTAEVTNKDDYAWFVGYAPANDPKYAVAVVVEQGGHGGSIAAPAARQILAALLGQKVEHVSATDLSR